MKNNGQPKTSYYNSQIQIFYQYSKSNYFSAEQTPINLRTFTTEY